MPLPATLSRDDAITFLRLDEATFVALEARGVIRRTSTGRYERFDLEALQALWASPGETPQPDDDDG